MQAGANVIDNREEAILEGELASFINSKPITTLHVIQFPSGLWGYVGSVPAEIGYIDATPEKIRAAKLHGGRFGPKIRTFATESDAITYAEERGYAVAGQPQKRAFDWRTAIATAKSFDDIQAVFVSLFPGVTKKGHSRGSSEIAIEYITRDLYKGKTLNAAVKSFVRKFKGKDNTFLGKVEATEEEIYSAVLDDKAEFAIGAARKMKPGMGSYALDGTAQQFNLPKGELVSAIKRKLGRDDGNGILRDYPNVVSAILESAAIDLEANKAATSPLNDLPAPTEAQKESGAYKKGHVTIRGLDISIENPAGSERSGVGRDGKKWTSKINHHYGYIKGTRGRDKDHLDVFLGPDPEGCDKVFVVNQLNPDSGAFDEHKIMMGFTSEEEAKDAYLSNYEDGWQGIGSICTLFVDEFKDWLKNGDTTIPVERGTVGSYRQDRIEEGATLPAVPAGTITEEAAHATAPAIAPVNWRAKLALVDDIDDISEIFRLVFQRSRPPSNSPYFRDTYGSVTVPLASLVARGPAAPSSVKVALERMKAAQGGQMEKRKPIAVLDMGNGSYKVLDGNATLHALMELGETEVIVETKKSLKQQGILDPKSIDEVYSQAEKALPTFKEWIEEYARQTGGQVNLRPGLKGRERASEKINKDYGGIASRLTDIIGGTLVFGSVEEVVEAYHKITADPAVYKAKNRFEKPTRDGYTDILMVVDIGGHLCELQLNTAGIIAAKESGLGHKIYDITRQLREVSKNRDIGDLAFLALGYQAALEDVSVKVYRDAAISAASSSDNRKASASEIVVEFERILVQLSESSISTHFDLALPSMRNIAPVAGSNAKGTSSFSQNSNLSGMSTPPLGEDSTISEGKVKIKKGSTDKTYLTDNTEIVIQYAVVNVGELVTSHSDSMTANEGYDQSLQPRDRSRKAMDVQVATMANNINPERLGASSSVTTGAPIIGNDAMVESGNGRIMALRQAYERGKADKYRQWLVDNAAEFGLRRQGIEAMSQPVLVRIRITEIDRAEFARKANEDEISRMSPAEQARSDAERMGTGDIEMFLPSEDGNIAAESNRPFIRAFLSKMGENVAAGYMTADGRFTKQIIDRIQAAMFQKAYKNDFLLALMAEEADPGIKNILSALTYAAGDFARGKDLDIVPLITDAVGLFKQSRNLGMSMNDLLMQGRIFEEIPEDTKALARFLDENIRSAKRMGRTFRLIAQRLTRYARESSQPALFDVPGKPSVPELLKWATEKEEQGELFESAPSGWREAIWAAKTFEDIKAVFLSVFGNVALGGREKEPWEMTKDEWKRHQARATWVEFTDDELTKIRIKEIAANNALAEAEHVRKAMGDIESIQKIMTDRDGALERNRKRKDADKVLEQRKKEQKKVAYAAVGMANHEDFIKRAIARGETVPPEVLKDYKDIPETIKPAELPAQFHIRRPGTFSFEIFPPIGEFFQGPDRDKIFAWGKAEGYAVKSAGNTGFKISAQGDNVIDEIPEPKPTKKQTETAAKKEAREEEIKQLKMDRAASYETSPAKQWITDIFGTDFANDHNQAALDRYIRGIDQEFGGLMNPKWKTGVEKLGITVTRETTVSEIVKAIKEKYLASEGRPVPTKVVDEYRDMKAGWDEEMASEMRRNNEIIQASRKPAITPPAQIFESPKGSMVINTDNGATTINRLLSRIARAKQTQKDDLYLSAYGDDRVTLLQAAILKLPPGSYTLTIEGRAAPSLRGTIEAIYGSYAGIAVNERLLRGMAAIYPKAIQAIFTHGLQEIIILQKRGSK